MGGPSVADGTVPPNEAAEAMAEAYRDWVGVAGKRTAYRVPWGWTAPAPCLPLFDVLHDPREGNVHGASQLPQGHAPGASDNHGKEEAHREGLL